MARQPETRSSWRACRATTSALPLPPLLVVAVPAAAGLAADAAGGDHLLQDRARVVALAVGVRQDVPDLQVQRVRRQVHQLERADRVAEDVLATGDEIEMDPMSARERRVVHERLRDRAGVETFSAGDEPNRYVVVAPLVSD